MCCVSKFEASWLWNINDVEWSYVLVHADVPQNALCNEVLHSRYGISHGWKVDVPQSLLVEKLDTERQTFRAIGGSTEPNSSTGQMLEPGLMKSWHILAQFIWFANEGE